MVTRLVMIATNNYVDISFTNEDDMEFFDEDEINKNYGDEPPTNKASLDYSEHILYSLMFKQLN